MCFILLNCVERNEVLTVALTSCTVCVCVCEMYIRLKVACYALGWLTRAQYLREEHVEEVGSVLF